MIPKPPPQPELNLVVLPSRNRPEIRLTNDFLFLETLRPDGTNGYWLGCLSVPVKPSEISQLELSVRNDNPSVPAEAVAVTVIAPTNLVIASDSSGSIFWNKAFAPGLDHLQFAAVILPDSGGNRWGRSLPPLQFVNASDFLNTNLMFKLQIGARGIADKTLVFWIGFHAAGETNDAPVLIPPLHWQK